MSTGAGSVPGVQQADSEEISGGTIVQPVAVPATR